MSGTAEAFARALLEDVKREAAESQITISGEVLPRLEEVTLSLAEVAVLRLEGFPNAEREEILKARAELLAAAAGISIASILRDVARRRLVDGVGGVFSILIRAIEPR